MPPPLPGPPPTTTTDVESYVLVWPNNAAQIAFWIWVIGCLVVLAWVELRGGSCWRGGRESGLCQHTRYDEPKERE